MNPEKLQQAIDLYDRFTHEGMDRRHFFARMTVIAGSAAAATGLISAIAASPAAAAIVPADDP
ncbi:MAG TPA: dienelactone hydrolase family protein, partial [Sphingomicrobium sp.]|nr:dienelactone hydrolase family protein [Sphingomicrobium sp.]